MAKKEERKMGMEAEEEKNEDKKAAQNPNVDGAEGPNEEWKVYKRRWWVLFVFSLLSIQQSAIWITYSVVAVPTQHLYHLHDNKMINLLLGLGAIVYVPTLFPVMWLADRPRGLRTMVLVGAAVDLVGAAIRCGARGPDTFFLVIIGQALNAAVGPIVMAIPPKLSAVWFPPRQRTTATAISGLANILGTTVGFLMGLFVKNSADVLLLVYVQSGLSAFVSLLIFIYFPAQPPSPPSPSSITTTTSSSSASTIFSSTTETEEEVANVNLSPGDKHPKKANEDITKGRKKMSLMRSLWKLLCNPNYVLLVLVGGLSGGIYNSWSALLDVVLGPLGYSQNEAAWLGAITTLAGIVSGVVVSKLADHIRHFKLILILMMAATALSLTWFTGMVNLHDHWHWLSDNFYLIATSVLLTGLFYNSTLPFFYEMAVEITYPVPEGTSSGILTLINNLGALVAIFSADYIAPKVMNWAITGSMATFAIVLIFLREQYKRDKYDNKITEGYFPIP